MKTTSILVTSLLACAVVHAAEEKVTLHEVTEQWSPVPVVVSAPADAPPSDAIVLFDGTDLDAWESTASGANPWDIVDGAMVVSKRAKNAEGKDISGDIRTKEAFGDVQLHLEFRTPAEVKGESQGRGNSGVFFMGKYELQVLDSYQNKTYVNGQAGAVYKQHPPLVNASRGPGEWQTYDVVFVAPRFDEDGKLIRVGRLTAFHNGVLVQHDVVIHGPTEHKGLPKYSAHPEKLPLGLQDHGNPTAFRNIWIRELDLPAPGL